MNEIDFEKMSDKEFLSYVMLNLEDFNHKSGGEGSAYFVKKSENDDRIVKRLHKKVPICAPFIFDDYCKEMQEYASKQYNVPKFYAWSQIPVFNHKTLNFKQEYFILQERVKGRELFGSFLKTIYPYTKQFCSKEEFLQAINNPNKYKSLYKKLLMLYSNDFVKMNSRICSYPESVLEEFLVQTYDIFRNSQFCEPDMYPSNIIVTNEKISLIDTRMKDREVTKTNTKEYTDDAYLTGIIWMFFFNNFVTNKKMFVTDTSDDDFIKILVSNAKNVRRVCKPAMIRVLKLANKNIDSLKFNNAKLFLSNYLSVQNMLSSNDAEEIFKEIQKNF